MVDHAIQHEAEAIHKVLRGDADAAQIATELGLPPQRLQAYQRFVENHIVSILDKIYTDLPKLLAPDQWQSLKKQYFLQVPPSSYELNRCAEPFIGFLEELLTTGLVAWLQPWHVELAQLEWAEFEVYSKQVELNEIAHQSNGYGLNPTLEIFQFSYPVGTLLKKLRKNNLLDAPLTFERQDETVFVFRHPKTLIHRFMVPTTSELLVFKMLADGLQIDDVAAQTGLPADDIVGYFEHAANAGLALKTS